MSRVWHWCRVLFRIAAVSTPPTSLTMTPPHNEIPKSFFSFEHYLSLPAD
jgi:hypothetical protein